MTVHMEPLLSRVDQKRRDLFRFRPLPPEVIDQVKGPMDLAWVHGCHAWDGGTLRRSEVADILETGLAVANRPITEHVEVLNLGEAVDWAEGWARSRQPLRPRDVKELHAILHQGLLGSSPGRYRTYDLGWDGMESTAALGREVPRRVPELCTWVNGREAKARHPIARAAVAYATMVGLMPFREGNDTVGRFMLNALLLQRSYPIAILEDGDVLRPALRCARSGDTVPLVAIIGEAVEKALDRYLAAL